MKVVVTIPAYNEARSLGHVLMDVKRVLSASHYAFTIQVVDDGSKDKTREIAKKAKVKVVSHQVKLGLAEVFRTEMEEALKENPDVIVHFDADGQYKAEEIPKLISFVEKGYDLVLGSRFRGTIESMSWLKRFGNRAFSRVIAQVTRLSISDGQTGFRAFTKDVAKKIPIESTFTYTQEQIIRVARKKFKIKEVPVYFARRQGKNQSRLMKNPLDFAIKAGINLIRVYRDYEPLKFFGAIGLGFFLLGFILGLFILYSLLQNGVVGGIPRVVLSGVLLITAVQIWSFWFLADMLKK